MGDRMDGHRQGGLHPDNWPWLSSQPVVSQEFGRAAGGIVKIVETYRTDGRTLFLADDGTFYYCIAPPTNGPTTDWLLSPWLGAVPTYVGETDA